MINILIDDLKCILMTQGYTNVFLRYVEANVRRTSEYRRYNSSLPTWLHNKPSAFTKHCIEKLGLAKEIRVENISYIETVAESYFRVRNLSKIYKVSFGSTNDSGTPSCECEDWKKTLLPCKHMIAVFENFQEFGWDSLPGTYTTSPYFNLDYDVINPSYSHTLKDEDLYSVVGDEVVISELPMKKYPKRTKASSCRELLSQIKSLTYLVNDLEVLDTVEDSLKDLVKLLDGKAPQDRGIVTESVNIRRPIGCSKLRSKIPQAKRLKSNLTGRVGVAAERRKFSSAVTIPKSVKNEEHEVTEEFAPIDDAVFDIPMESDEILDVCPEITEPDEAIKNEGNKTKKRKIEDDEDDEEVVVTGFVKPRGKIKKSRKLVFSDHEKSIIIDKEMLSDESINIAMNLIHKQFPDIGGFTDTSIGKNQKFDILPYGSRYIQILHAGSLHWVCVANTSANRKDNQEHYLYDSLIGNKIEEDLFFQIAFYSLCRKDELIIQTMPVQQQKNSVDCGPFAIAFATTLAFGGDPSDIVYDPEGLRPHLLHCLEAGKMEEFPTLISSKRSIRAKKRTNAIELFCSCRTPYKENTEMAQCDFCNEWYHKRCEKIPDMVFRNKTKQWSCRHCKSTQV